MGLWNPPQAGCIGTKYWIESANWLKRETQIIKLVLKIRFCLIREGEPQTDPQIDQLGKGIPKMTS